MDRTEPVRVNLNLRDEEYKTMHSFTLLVISYFTLPAFILVLAQNDIIPAPSSTEPYPVVGLGISGRWTDLSPLKRRRDGR